MMAKNQSKGVTALSRLGIETLEACSPRGVPNDVVLPASVKNAATAFFYALTPKHRKVAINGFSLVDVNAHQDRSDNSTHIFRRGWYNGILAYAAVLLNKEFFDGRLKLSGTGGAGGYQWLSINDTKVSCSCLRDVVYELACHATEEELKRINEDAVKKVLTGILPQSELDNLIIKHPDFAILPYFGSDSEEDVIAIRRCYSDGDPSIDVFDSRSKAVEYLKIRRDSAKIFIVNEVLNVLPTGVSVSDVNKALAKNNTNTKKLAGQLEYYAKEYTSMGDNASAIALNSASFVLRSIDPVGHMPMMMRRGGFWGGPWPRRELP
jgi:hypothetical protein